MLKSFPGIPEQVPNETGSDSYRREPEASPRMQSTREAVKTTQLE